MKEYALLFASAIVSAVVSALGVFRRRERVPERILVVKLDHVGDLVLATPAIRALRDSRPDARIDALVGPGSAFVLAKSSAVDRVIVYDSPWFRRAPAPAKGSIPQATTRSALEALARDRYTAIVELRGDPRTLLLPFHTGARRRMDLGTTRLLYWIWRRFGDRPLWHDVETNLEIVRPLLSPEVQHRVQDATPERSPLEVPRAPDADRSLDAKLEAAGADPHAPLVTIHAGASWRGRAWDRERFAAVADWIRGHYHAQVAFVGSDDERDIEEAIRESMRGGRVLWLTGALTWEELHALLARSWLFLGNDGGPAHLAAAAGAFCVTLFGPTDPSRFRPWSERALALQRRDAVRGRRVRDIRVNDIQVDEVTATIARLLDVPARASDLALRRTAGGNTP